MPIQRFEAAKDAAIATLEAERDQIVRAQTANTLAEMCRHMAEEFGEQRTSAFNELRELGWSLGDLSTEFGVTRARIAQVACRDRYKSGESRGGGSRRGRSTRRS